MNCVKVTGIILLAALSMSLIGAGSASAMKAIPLLEDEPTLKPIEPGDPLQFASNDVELESAQPQIAGEQRETMDEQEVCDGRLGTSADCRTR